LIGRIERFSRDQHSSQNIEQFPHTSGEGDLFGFAAFDEAVIVTLQYRVVSHGHTIRISPPLIINEREIDYIVERLEKVLID
jgi:4-aminobutyrate aminotransferase-like enzyme